MLTLLYFTEEPAKGATVGSIVNEIAVKVPETSDAVTTEVQPSSIDGIAESKPEIADSIEAPARLEGSVDKDDDLARELEEIEGSKKEENIQPEKIASCQATQKTSDLIKDLESDTSSIELAAIKVNAKTSETIASTPKLIDEVVDSTTENLIKRKHSADNLTLENDAKKLNIDQPQTQPEQPTNSKTLDELKTPSEEPTAMEVDQPNDAAEDKADDVTMGQKEEAITSTSSEVLSIADSEAKVSDTEIVVTANASDASVSGSTEEDAPKETIAIDTKTIELTEEPVSSTADLSTTESSKSVVGKEADSSKASDVNATNKTSAPIATTKDKESMETSTAQEDSTITMDCVASDAIRKELRTATSGATIDIDVDCNESNVSAATTNGDGNKKPENKLLTNMNNGGSSTPNSYPASPATIGGGSNVFNSTPIQKQFEVKSENVSKIDEHSKTNITEDATPDASKTSDALTTTGKFSITSDKGSKNNSSFRIFIKCVENNRSRWLFCRTVLLFYKQTTIVTGKTLCQVYNIISPSEFFFLYA